MHIFKLIILVSVLVFNLIHLPVVYADAPQESQMEAVITKIIEEKPIETNGAKHLYQNFELVTLGDKGGKIITAESGGFLTVNAPKYQIGDKVVVTTIQGPDGKDMSYISDYVRRNTLYLLFSLFIVITIFIGRKKGFLSLLGMAFSFGVIFYFILPQILSGHDPVLISIIGALCIIPVTFTLSHGWNRKTLIAVAGTVIALIVTGVLASIFVESSKLSGFSSDEAGFLQVAKGGLLNIKGLLLAGIIIGALGILDDITVSQSAIVFQLNKTSPGLKMKELYDKAMEIGTDHIASVVNTLVLVYTGAAMPLFLLFIDNPKPFGEIINYEIVAEEIVRTLVASIGLILAVPITTFLAAYFVSKK